MPLSKPWKIQGWWFLAYPFNSLVWLLKKADGTWRRTVNYHKLNYKINLLFQMWSLYWSKSTHTEAPGMWRWSEKCFIFKSMKQKWTRSGLLSLFGQEYKFILLLLNHINYRNFCHQFVYRDLWLFHHFIDHYAGPLYWWHYINRTWWIRSSWNPKCLTW